MIMEQKDDMRKYVKCYDKSKHLFGFKIEGQRDWYVEPCFEELGTCSSGWVKDDDPEVWFKQNGRYGLYNVTERRAVLPAVYGYPLFFGKNSEVATAWKDYKAGVIDRQGNEVIPIIYDEIYCRTRRVPMSRLERRCVKDEEGKKHYVGPRYKEIFCGYACFTNEGGVQAYDENCQPCEFFDWEAPRMNCGPKYDNKETETMTVEELEELIRKEYVRLLELGYESKITSQFSEKHRKQIYNQEDRVNSLISDRRAKMDQSWVHNAENAHRIGRTNRLLMRAVEKAIALGKRTSKSLQWMEKVSHTASYYVDVSIHPEWEDSKSDLRYERKYMSKKEEDERLDEDNCELADTHIWNIIAKMGIGCKYEGFTTCFDASSDEYRPDYWDIRELTLDDGQSWDELIHFPAYQDEYFTVPFHALYCDCYNYSFEDLCNINDFRINVEVELETREQD